MPSATVTGALLGLAYQIHANSVRKRRSDPFKHVVAMAIGAVIANQIVVWDKKIQQRILARREYQPGLVVHSQQAEQSKESDQSL